jgi:cell division protein FtsB
MTQASDRKPSGKPRGVRKVLTFITVALALNAVAGERGLLDMLRARDQQKELTASIAALKAENGLLRRQVLHLKEDPDTIEAIARRELGLMRPGEVLFVVHGRSPQ